MKRIYLLLAVPILLAGALPAQAARCTGKANCQACTTCEYCKHCAEGGGTCGVCAPAPKKAPPAKKAPAKKAKKKR